MEIVEAIVHRLSKAMHTQGEDSVQLSFAPAVLPIDETLTNVCTELLALYSRSPGNSGRLGGNPDLHVFPVRLGEYLRGELSFREVTEKTARLIANRMETVAFSSGGHALFLRYRVLPNDFFVVAMLKLKAGAGINEDDLTLLPTLSIDLDKLNEAARINLTRYLAGEAPNLTFIKGQRKQEEVTEYFRNALGCENYSKAKDQTKALIRAADDFVMSRADLDHDAKILEKQAARGRLYDCLRAAEGEVDLHTAAAAVSPADALQFVAFSQRLEYGERVYEFDERFRPDKATYRVLRRISGSMGSVRLSFDVQDVLDGKVTYLPDCDSIQIQHPSASLKSEIQNNERPAAN